MLLILDIYRKYYGWRMMTFILVTFYVSMAAFQAAGLVPAQRAAAVAELAISFNYTTVLNIIFLVLAAVLVRRFLGTGGPKMLRMMNMPATPAAPAAAMPSMEMHHG